jgi:hypothetical protein
VVDKSSDDDDEVDNNRDRSTEKVDAGSSRDGRRGKSRGRGKGRGRGRGTSREGGGRGRGRRKGAEAAAAAPCPPSSPPPPPLVDSRSDVLAASHVREQFAVPTGTPPSSSSTSKPAAVVEMPACAAGANGVPAAAAGDHLAALSAMVSPKKVDSGCHERRDGDAGRRDGLYLVDNYLFGAVFEKDALGKPVSFAVSEVTLVTKNIFFLKNLH